MINFSLHAFIWMMKGLGQERVIAAQKALNDPKAIVSPVDWARFEGHFQFASRIIREMVLQAAIHRVERTTVMMQHADLTYAELERELSVLAQAVENDVETERFHHYPRAKGLMILNYTADWQATLKAFPSADEDIKTAVDCYALGHGTASVSSSMRVAERGLRAFAWAQKIKGIPHGKKLKPIEWANWLEIIRELEAKQRALRQGSPGAKKDAEQAFYSGVLADLNSFKDEFRNMVAHVRVSYDELQALRALEEVKKFMNRIAGRIDENGKKVKT
jgi:hypothetical protein